MGRASTACWRALRSSLNGFCDAVHALPMLATAFGKAVGVPERARRALAAAMRSDSSATCSARPRSKLGASFADLPRLPPPRNMSMSNACCMSTS